MHWQLLSGARCLNFGLTSIYFPVLCGSSKGSDKAALVHILVRAFAALIHAKISCNGLYVF